MISISRMKELAEEENEKLKAYIVSDRWNNDSTVIFAESANKAKSQALYDEEFQWHDYEYVDLRVRRMKEWDKYSKEKKIPIEELLKYSWWFYCSELCGKEINEDHVKNGEAIIIEDTDNGFVSGNVICKECFEKKRKQL